VSDILKMAISPTEQGDPTRIGYWFNKTANQTVGSYTLQTAAGWADVIHNNDKYAYGFWTSGNDVYLRLPGDEDPNDYYVTIAYSASKDFAPNLKYSVPNVRLSGLEFRIIGPEFFAAANHCVIDHCLFYDTGITFTALQPSQYGSDHVIQHNRFISTSVVSPDGGLTQGIPWTWIKGNVWVQASGGVNTGYFARVGEAEENSCIFFRGGAKRVVVRNNYMSGYFNGVAYYNYQYDRYAAYAIDIIDNIMIDLADDAVEPEFSNMNGWIGNNIMTRCPVAVSSGPVEWGPLFVTRNTIWKAGAENVVKDDAGNTGVESGLGFKASTSSVPPAKIYVINNTFWSDLASAEFVAPYAGGSSFPESFYLRNNIIRATRYAALPASTADAYWDEDYNHWYTSDAARGIGNSLTISAYRTATGEGAHSNLSADFHTSIDSQFENVTTGDLSLISGSAFRNTGCVFPVIADSWNSTAPDLGSEEM
jgi:hypothetical protein